jgi:hypothetical protein
MADAKSIPSKAEIIALAQQTAAKYGLDPAAFVGQLAQESGNFNPRVVSGEILSSAKAQGVAQFMPATAKAMGIDPLNVPQAIDGAARYMVQLKKQFGSEELARQAYNWGPGNLAQHLKNPKARPMPKETADYNQQTAKWAARYGAPRDQGGTEFMAQQVVPGPKMNDQQALQMAQAQVDAGLPAGAAAPAPVKGQPEWMQQLASMSAPQGFDAQPGAQIDEHFAQALNDQVAAQQDNVLAAMFNADFKPTHDTSVLPGAVDRYLNKVLSA